jgi:hypothetical protein
VSDEFVHGEEERARIRRMVASPLPDDVLGFAAEYAATAILERDPLVRVLCGAPKCGRRVGRVYPTPLGPLYAGHDSGDGDHGTTGADMKQYRHRHRETGDMPQLWYGQPSSYGRASSEQVTGRPFTPPRGLRGVLDFPLMDGIDHEPAAG